MHKLDRKGAWREPLKYCFMLSALCLDDPRREKLKFGQILALRRGSYVKVGALAFVDLSAGCQP